MDDAARSPYFAHFVMLDENIYSAFATSDADEAQAAAEVLADAFGADRVSMWSTSEDTVAEWQNKVSVWAADPRLDSPPA